MARWIQHLKGWRVQFAIATGIGAVLLGLVVLEHMRSVQQRVDYGYLSRTNHWIASQLQLEHLRFLRAVDHFVQEPNRDHDDLMLRFDLLWSRISPFMIGPEAAATRKVDGAVETVENLEAALIAVEPLVAGLAPGDTQKREAIFDRLEPFQEPLRKLTYEAAIGSRYQKFLDDIEESERQAFLFQAAIFAVAFLLIIGLLFVLRESHRLADRERRAKEAATAANQAKTMFLANMSHELRTPLNAVIGFSDVMQKEMLGPIGTPAYRGYAKDINAAGAHLLALIEDILDVSRIEVDRIRLNEEIVDLRDVLDFALHAHSGNAQDAGVALLLDAPDELPAVMGDSRRLRQVMMNLIGNAIKFSFKGGRVTVSARHLATGMIELEVVDEGTGIAKEEMASILQPFHQGAASIAQNKGGAGLGLPLVKNLTELHGGSFVLESVVGEGTRAIVRLPVGRAGSPEPTGQSASRTLSAPSITLALQPNKDAAGSIM